MGSVLGRERAGAAAGESPSLSRQRACSIPALQPCTSGAASMPRCVGFANKSRPGTSGRMRQGCLNMQRPSLHAASPHTALPAHS